LDHGFTTVKEAITGLVDAEAVEQAARDTGTDRVLQELDRILRGHVGGALEPQAHKEAIAEGMRRVAAEVPPGYKDKDKDDEDASGDYLVWEEILREVERRQCDVLLVTADLKEDWWRKDHGQARGPRLELVEEMRRRAGVRLFMLRPDSLLLHARQVLEIEVRDQSVQDIERIDKSFAEGESQVQHVKETLAEDFELKAEWRDQKAEEWPDDTRNARAAEGLRGLAQYVRTLQDDDPRLRRLARVWSSGHPDGGAAQLLLDTYGFGPGSHLGLPDHDLFLTDYANEWTVSSW
jgi:PIN like domain